MRVPTLIFLIVLFSSSACCIGEEIDFNRDIRPLLSDRCFVCHGPDEANREADLRLDLAEAALGESQSGNAERVVTPGDIEQSELWLRITSDDEDLLMPPPDSNLKLTTAERDLLKAWIQGGAKYDQHWSFAPIVKADIPVPDAGAIDYFIQKKLAERAWQLAPVAPREQLLRRLTFDLTGLPPTEQDRREFAEGDLDTAIEQTVDRLLGSPRYGERMASVWLDVARYSDTYGYQVDRDRFVWPWRDWVIRAFNDNLPYDQFVTQQLAGDLLPQPTEDQVLATTFNRLHPQKVEGGSVPEEFRIEYVADRTQTFATSMLGLTLECARCHDHKYDPLTQKEYYQLTAFFDKIDEAGLYSYFTPSIPTPTLMLDVESKREELQKAAQEVSEAESKLAEQKRNVSLPKDFAVTVPQPVESLDFEDYKPGGRNRLVDGPSGKAVTLSGDDAVKLKQGNFRRYDPFSVSLLLKVPKSYERAVVFHRSRAWTDAGSRGYQMLLEDGRLSFSLIHFWPGNAIRVRSEETYPVGQWHRIAVTYDGSSRAAGVQLFVDGERIPVEIVRDNLYKQIAGGGNDHISIGERFRDVGLRDGVVDEFQVFDRELTPAEVAVVHQPDSAKSLSPDELLEVAAAHDSEVVAQRERLRDARKRSAELGESFQEIMVMREMAQQRKTYLLGRGAYDNRLEEVSAETPAALPSMPSELPRNRLGLARWLTSGEHPLTARVAVNRIWQMLFGEGLVRTPEDFGSQGQLPTHPKLLDWLASDFMEHGWDVKRLIRQIVMSKTYLQTSVASAEKMEQDPENRLYGRAPSYRLPAEMLRDQALAVSGLMVEKMGGPPVKPYDLEVSFKPMKPDDGEGLYRRSVYTFWKRTGPAPAMMALDAAKRDVCRVQRSRTSSPLQTLVLMNGPQFVEAARWLATRAIETSDGTDGRLAWMFGELTGRHPTDEELAVLTQLYQQQLELFDDETAKSYLAVGKKPTAELTRELAALSAVANALFGLDESMMKR